MLSYSLFPVLSNLKADRETQQTEARAIAEEKQNRVLSRAPA